MGNKVRMIIALIIIIGVAYWSFNLVRTRSYSGSNISFDVKSGSVVVTNPGQATVPVEMQAAGRMSTFRIASPELGLNETSKREGSGRTTYHAISFDLPPGQAKIDVTRGSNVKFISSSPQRIEAVVTPMGPAGVRTTLGFAALIIGAGLYYISRLTEHRWLGVLRSKLPENLPGVKRTAT